MFGTWVAFTHHIILSNLPETHTICMLHNNNVILDFVNFLAAVALVLCLVSAVDEL